jgi:tetratricopeptide (TPR) repeat protein
MSATLDGKTEDDQPLRTAGAVPYQRELLVSLSLVAATALVFANLCRTDYEFFQLDDKDYVTANEHVNTGLTSDNVRWALTSWDGSKYYQPATWISLQIDCQLFGLRPWGFRLTNILLHATNTVLLFWVLRRMTGALWRSAMVAALFALHPLHVESVAWVTERKDVLSAFFWMLAVGTYTLYAERPSWPCYVLTLIAFALALLAKPIVVTLPFVLLLFDYWPLGRWTRLPSREARAAGAAPTPRYSLLWLVAEKVPMFVLAAGISVLTVLGQENAMYSLEALPLEGRIINALVSYFEYVRQVFWPSDLAVFYPPPEGGWSTGRWVSAGLLLAVVTLVVTLLRRRAPYCLVGWLWFLGMLVPNIGLVQAGMQARADRFTYLALIGLLVMLCWGIPDLLARWHQAHRFLPWFAAAVLAGCAAFSWQQVGYWQNSITMWQHTLLVTSPNKQAHFALGLEFMARDQLSKAHEQFTAALKIDPNYNVAQSSLSLTLLRLSDPAQAAAMLRELAARYPENAVVHYSLGRALFRMPGLHDEAMQQLRAALAIDPAMVDALESLGFLLLFRGNEREARSQFLEALKHAPKSAQSHMGLGLTYLLGDQPSEALRCFEAAVRCDVRHIEAHYNLAFALHVLGRTEEATQAFAQARKLAVEWPERAGLEAWVWATHPDPRQRNGRLALLRARVICAATEHQNSRLLDALAAAYADQGRFEEATNTVRKAMALPSVDLTPGLADQLQRRLELYQQNKPFRAASPGAYP